MSVLDSTLDSISDSMTDGISDDSSNNTGVTDLSLAFEALAKVRQNADAAPPKGEYKRYPNSLDFETTTVGIEEPNGFFDMFKYSCGKLYCKENGLIDSDYLLLDGVEIPVVNVIFAMYHTFIGVDVIDQPKLASLVIGHVDGNINNTYASNLYLMSILD